MKTKIRLLGLPEEYAVAVSQILSQCSLELSEEGLCVFVEQGEVLSLKKEDSSLRLIYSRPHEIFRALSRLRGFILSEAKALSEPRKTDTLTYMPDLSRNAVMTVANVKKLIRNLALSGYDSVMLYTEDTYELENYPYFGYQRGRYTKAELREIDAYGALFGLEVIPCIQTLAHLDTFLRWNSMAALRDTAGILLAGSEKTYDLIREMLATCRSCFRSKRINIGMDEAHLLGCGAYKKLNGYRESFDIFLEHLNRVSALCEEYGFAPMIWSDMFFRIAFGKYYVDQGEIPAEIRARVPKNVSLIFWDYYSRTRETFGHMLEEHKRFDNPAVFAGGVSKWYGYAPLNRFSIRLSDMQMELLEAHGVREWIITAWSSGGCEAADYSVLPSMLYFAEGAYGAPRDDAAMERRCLECFGIGYADLMKLDLPNVIGAYDPDKVANPCKYLLFNDPLLGLMDLTVQPDFADTYRAHARELKPLTEHPEWGYLFDTMYRLCDVLIEKCDLSTRIRTAYLNRDLEALRAIAGQIPVTVEKLDALLLAMRRQWYLEHKGFGFETHELSVGGLRARLLGVAQILLAYLDGELSSIEELDQERLPFPNSMQWCRGFDFLTPNKI